MSPECSWDKCLLNVHVIPTALYIYTVVICSKLPFKLSTSALYLYTFDQQEHHHDKDMRRRKMSFEHAPLCKYFYI